MLAIRYMRSICDVMLMSLFDKFLFKILFTNTTKLQFILFRKLLHFTTAAQDL